MPLIISTNELRPGMRLLDPFMSGDQIMVQPDRALSEGELEILQRRFPTARVRVADPVLDNIVQFEDDRSERELASEAQRRVAGCLTQVSQRYASRASPQDVDFGALHAAVRELLAHLEKHPASAALVAQCTDSSTYLGLHTGNVFYLSMLLGAAALHLIIAERKRAPWAHAVSTLFMEDLTPLGLGVLLMDLGLIPQQHLLKKEEPLTVEERQALLDHPQLGASLLPPNINAVSRMVVRAHHENCTGTGYPKGLSKGRLDIFTRIVRIADAYDAATSEGVFPGARSPARALWEMSCGPSRHFFDPELMRIFSRLIQPFPIGSKLRLNDGRYAVVAKYDRRHPFNPTVVIAFDAQDRPLPQQQLVGPMKLGEQTRLRIASLFNEDLSFIHAAHDAAVTCSAQRFTTPFEFFYP